MIHFCIKNTMSCLDVTLDQSADFELFIPEKTVCRFFWTVPHAEDVKALTVSLKREQIITLCSDLKVKLAQVPAFG